MLQADESVVDPTNMLYSLVQHEKRNPFNHFRLTICQVVCVNTQI